MRRRLTLVELVIVIVVLGILAGLALFAAGGGRSSSLSLPCRADLAPDGRITYASSGTAGNARCR